MKLLVLGLALSCSSLICADDRRSSPFAQAIFKNDVAGARKAIKAGADINFLYAMGAPLITAAVAGRNPMVQMLIEEKADLNVKDPYDTNPATRDWTAYDWAKSKGHNDTAAILKNAMDKAKK